MPRAFQDFGAQVIFQLLDRPAKGWLGDVETPGRTREAEFLSDGLKISEMTKFKRHRLNPELVDLIEIAGVELDYLVTDGHRHQQEDDLWSPVGQVLKFEAGLFFVMLVETLECRIQ